MKKTKKNIDTSDDSEGLFEQFTLQNPTKQIIKNPPIKTSYSHTPGTHNF